MQNVYLNPAYSKAIQQYLRYGIMPDYDVPRRYLCQVEVVKIEKLEKFYIWRTRQDNKVRATHAVLHGRVFKWGEPYETEPRHPGYEKNCRCHAENINTTCPPEIEPFIDNKDVNTWPKPPINGRLEVGLPTKNKTRNKGEKCLYDQYGGRWRPHINPRHNLHWDYQARAKGATWLNIPI